ncbi:DNA internalization-related competence protein ComEC/Rec2 [Massilia sp. P8910]|uniref:DNA internalization-related competence protein ComEC/Rec2 n=1 Tax=Massilia antarctica TaxID=2765360 RepID=UPI001E61E769|nr:DNA internalization-related competence protein ComEC/Rec2 [Massilia antarctica]MCE3606323.1 DNA internalization-related competence protein ComEC/Rec2 [Massilia antarctica]
MRAAILGFACGAGLLQIQPVLPSPSTMAACAAIAVLLCLLRGVARLAMAGALSGFCWAALAAHLALAPALAKAGEGRDITVVGIVDSLPFRFDDGVRFNFKVERVLGEPVVVPPRVSLAWYAGYRDAAQSIGDVQPGERWQLVVRLQRPHGNMNPYGFDYEAWLLEQGVRATGYVRPEGGTTRRLDGFVFSLSNLVEHCRATLRERILRALPGKEYAGVIVALVVGDQRAIGQADWDVFNRTGIGHLISISGLHITMVAGLFASLASLLWRRSFFTDAQLPLLMPAPKVAALTGAAVALLYVLLAGFGVPAQRTLYMLTVVAAALWFGRLTQVSHVLCVALGVVVVLDPWAIASPGFWLSFGAVAAILFATTGRTVVRQPRWRGVLLVAARTQYVVTLALVPLTMLLFSQVSIVSPLANAVAIPVVSFVVTPLALAGSMLPPPLSTLLLNAAHYAVQGLAWALGWCSGLRFAVWSAPAPEPWLFVFAVVGTLWMLAPRGWPHRWTGLAAWLPLLTAQPVSPPQGEVFVTAFDVGQGMALLIETGTHRLLYDTGPAYTPESNGANRVILPYLKARGIGFLDGVVVSHSDIDHAGGARTLLGALKVGWVSSSLWFDHPIVEAAPRHIRCSGGQQWTWDRVRFEMLHPSVESYADTSLKPNARGCVLRITAGVRSILLAADIEAAQEARLVAGSAQLLRAEVLLAPHHGSGTSSTPAFLAAVQPRLVLFQVGYRNRYHHPKTEVVERYEKLGIERLRSDESGAIMLDSASGFAPVEYRRGHARYWYGK